MFVNSPVNWRNILLPHGSTIRDAIECLNDVSLQIAMVVNAQGSMIGTVTDGDIRRSLLRGELLDTPVEQIMCTDFYALSETATDEEAQAIMLREAIQHIPALNKQGQVVRLFLLSELVKPKKRSNLVVIMAGGKGKRLHPLTQDCPKPMLRVGGKPMLEIILDQCIAAGFQHFYLSVNYLKSQIMDYFGNGARWGVGINYLEEDQPLGTGGALDLLPQKPSEPILLINGDVLTRVDFASLLKFHDEQQAAATLCVREYKTKIQYGVVRMKDLKVLGLDEKPIAHHYINAGIYLLDPALIDLVPHNQSLDMPQLLEKAIESQYHVSAFPIHEYWLDVGQPDTFERARDEWV